METANSQIGSDRYAFEVLKKTDKWAIVRQLEAIPDKENGFDYYTNQVYTYKSAPNCEVALFTKRKNGKYVKDGEPMKGGTSISFGPPNFHQDPNF